MKSQIRKMVEQDIDVVVQIIRAHDPFDGECAERYFKEYFGDLQRIESPDEEHFVVVAETTGKVAGVSGFTPDKYKTPKIYWLGWTYVDENFRRCGLGSTLLQHVIERVSLREVRKLYIDTSSHPIYSSALRLYKRFGFQEEGALQDYYNEGEDFVILGKYLHPVYKSE